MQKPGPDLRLLAIALIVFIDMAGIGLIVPILPSLIVDLGHLRIDGAALIGGHLLFVYAAMQFLFSPVIGGLSDRFGRRPVLIGTLAALGVDYAMMAWAPTLGWLFAGRVISGIMGATWAAANSCVADICPPEKRGRMFGMLGGAGAAGFVVGPAVGGLLGGIHLRLPFAMASVFTLSAAVLGYFVLRETLPVDRRRAFALARANPFGSLIRMSRNHVVIGVLTTIFLMQLAAQSQLATWGFFLIAKFAWSPLQIGLSVAVFGIMLVIAQGVLTGPMIARFGERRSAAIGLAVGLPSYVLLAVAGAGWVVYLAIVVGALGGLAFPAMQSMMTACTDEDAQGELQGAIASTVGLTSIIGPLMMTWIFSDFTDARGLYFPGAPFIAAAVLMVLANANFHFGTARLRSPVVATTQPADLA